MFCFDQLSIVCVYDAYVCLLCCFGMFYTLFDLCFFFFFKQKTAYEMRISDWSSDVCSSDLAFDDCEKLAPSSPAKVAMLATPSIPDTTCCARASTSLVRSSEAPGGNCTTPISTP